MDGIAVPGPMLPEMMLRCAGVPGAALALVSTRSGFGFRMCNDNSHLLICFPHAHADEQGFRVARDVSRAIWRAAGLLCRVQWLHFPGRVRELPAPRPLAWPQCTPQRLTASGSLLVAQGV